MTDSARTELVPGYSISRIINGCWQLTPDHGGGPDKKNIMDRFAEQVDHGFTTFDCADIYVGVEELLGNFRRSLGQSNEIQIHTKYAPDKSLLAQLTGEQIDAAINRSLQRLGVERLDLVQIHCWDYAVPGLEMMVEKLSRLQEAGKIRYLGVTNFDSVNVAQIMDSGTDIVSLQTQYSLLDRRPESRLTDLTEKRSLRLLPYGVLAGGFLSEAYLGVTPPAEMNRSLQKYRLIIEEVGGWETYQNLLSVLKIIARKHNTKIEAVAARWILDRPSVSAVILGLGKKPHAAFNQSITSLQLDTEDNSAIADQLTQQAVPPGDMYELERDVQGVHAGIIKTELHSSDSNA